jgi:hypothetical protein
VEAAELSGGGGGSGRAPSRSLACCSATFSRFFSDSAFAYSDEKVANRHIRVWHGFGAVRKRSLHDGRIQNPSSPVGIVPLSNFAPRGFGFVHHSIAILYHEVPNLISRFATF